MNATKEDVKAALAVLQALAQVIREINAPVALGPLYAQCMPLIDLEGFNKAIGLLRAARLIKDAGNHQVVWCGPV